MQQLQTYRTVARDVDQMVVVAATHAADAAIFDGVQCKNPTVFAERRLGLGSLAFFEKIEHHRLACTTRPEQ